MHSISHLCYFGTILYIQVRSKDSQVKTQLVLWIFISFNPLNSELNPICYLLALLAHRFLHVSRIMVKSLPLRLLMSYIYMEPIFLMFLDHTRRRTTVGMTPLDEWSARRRDLYLTTHDTHNRQISMPPVGLEPTISAGERVRCVNIVAYISVLSTPLPTQPIPKHTRTSLSFIFACVTTRQCKGV